MEKRRGQNQKPKPRIEIIDIAKAITIFLVMMGHTVGNFDASMFRRILYAFHMPLFFFLAGLSTKPRSVLGVEQWKAFLRKNILALVVPYLIWGLIYAPFDFANIGLLAYGSWASIAQTGTLSSLWYLTCFFVARLMAQACVSALIWKKVDRVHVACMVASVPFFVIGVLLPYLEPGYPWCLNVSFAAAGFILLGMGLRRSILILSVQKTEILAAVFAASLVVFCAGTVVRGDALELMRMCEAEYGNLFWFFMNSASGTMIVLSASMLLARVAHEGARPFSLAAVSFIGSHTLGIFLLHKNLLQQLVMPMLEAVPLPDFVLAFIASAIVLPITMGLCVVIERYIPELLGQFPVWEPVSVQEAEVGSAG